MSGGKMSFSLWASLKFAPHGREYNGNPIERFSGLYVDIDPLASPKQIDKIWLVFKNDGVYSADNVPTSTPSGDVLTDTERWIMIDSLLIPSSSIFVNWISYEPIDLLILNLQLKHGVWNTQIVAKNGDAWGFSTAESLTVEAPLWEKEFEVQEAPPMVINGKARIDQLKIYKYDADNHQWSNTYDTFAGLLDVTEVGASSWKFKYTFSEDYVDDLADVNPDVKIELAYTHYDTDEKEYRRAFFNTTRNQNYSNGIYNVMFVGGVVDHPNFSSRVWWSYINDPLYFPDTNYSEVGSNDTAIVGLTKVGDYLSAVKQSKTTDTAIYLLYPTSFEDDTTFAVKQGVQGVGALARYSFNILGDETLFLSPNGVMAIVPTQDEEHKTQNRSYFVDKKLLAEDNISSAYSFVFDGKYYLSTGNGHCYVLDGNQRNSWGNDRTNLVYECYFLDNVPAKCFVKYKDKLVFTDGNNICWFTDGFTDAYDKNGWTDVAVSAEWSTVFDDDGSLHYYKTMQKKGNVVSILPRENELPYKEVTITQTQFNEDPTQYFTYNGVKYVRCKVGDTYDAGGTYFVENRSNTKVYVRKDDKGEVEIERQFGLSSDIPSEMFLRKKFKKYKRLQFIIRNEVAEPFGVDSIVKNYTVGNYAKK